MRTTTADIAITSTPRRAAPQSIGRVLQILERLVAARTGPDGHVTLGEIAESTGAPKSSLLGLLQGLQDEDCIIRDADGAYALGPRFLRLATNAVLGEQMVEVLRPVLAELVAETGETAVLGVLSADQTMVTYLDRLECHNPIRYTVETGVQRELHCTAGGKLLLAHMPPARLDEILSSVTRVRFTDATVTDGRKLRAELTRIRETGMACTADERIVGASGMAIPVFGPDGAAVATILIAGPSDRMRLATEANQAAMRRAATRCRELGFHAPADRQTD